MQTGRHANLADLLTISAPVSLPFFPPTSSHPTQESRGSLGGRNLKRLSQFTLNLPELPEGPSHLSLQVYQRTHPIHSRVKQILNCAGCVLLVHFQADGVYVFVFAEEIATSRFPNAIPPSCFGSSCSKAGIVLYVLYKMCEV